jgi:hypothetical protein
LLRLPSEIRTTIWRFVVGGHVLRHTYINHTKRRPTYSMTPPVSERPGGLALPRTCRQIYADVVLLPYKVNTFSFAPNMMVKHDIGCLKPIQRSQITDIQLELVPKRGWRFKQGTSLQELAKLSKYNFDFLPKLERIHILVFDTRQQGQQSYESCVSTLRSRLQVFLANKTVRITFEAANEPWDHYDRR